MSSERLAPYIKARPGSEHRIYELLAEITESKISMEGIDVVNDENVLALYHLAENAVMVAGATGILLKTGEMVADAASQIAKKIIEMYKPKTTAGGLKEN